jgi:hypothetical protein
MKDRAVAALENEEVEKDDNSNRDAEQPQNHTAHRWTFLSPRTWAAVKAPSGDLKLLQPRF